LRHREAIEAHTREKRYLLEFGVLQVWQSTTANGGFWPIVLKN
jgi:hypothetical protein